MLTITSLQNPSVRAWRALKTRAGRDECGQTLMEGHHLAGEALASMTTCVRALLVDETRIQEFALLLAQADARGVETVSLPSRVMDAILDARTPQGVAAVADMPAMPRTDELGPRVIALENVQDPGNVGTILRTADAAGFTGLLLTPACADPFSPKTLRAAMGATLRVPVRVSDDFYGDLARMPLTKLAGALGGDDFYQGAPCDGRVALLIGNEGAGLTPRALALADRKLALPMPGHAESLNAAVAAGVMMYVCLHKANGAWPTTV